ncbi:hypothetical protein EVAR_88641_1 [Eumeta japonica]|uniref:Uncharacterized protein n=1 Tax=Eumeta variegata TaxID=151549 RepID=A0A4C1X216_EUMVA|nr:hypothetical protein EVAR_88641_1 [Eumeta japonica]
MKRYRRGKPRLDTTKCAPADANDRRGLGRRGRALCICHGRVVDAGVGERNVTHDSQRLSVAGHWPLFPPELAGRGVTHDCPLSQGWNIENF